MNETFLTPNFTLSEFCNWKKYPDNIPTPQVVNNMIYGCRHLLEPARQAIGCPVIVNSGYRNPRVNTFVGGVRNSQHILGQAADIRPKDPQQFQRLIAFLRSCEYTDQLLTGHGWLHISWKPLGVARHYIRIGYYK